MTTAAPRRDERWFALFVVTTVGVALAGVAIGWHAGSAWTMPLRDVRAALLKFYPFRLADAFVPLAFSLSFTRLLAWKPLLSSPAPPVPRSPVSPPRLLALTLLTLAAFTGSLLIASPGRNPSRMDADRLAAWTDVAEWVRENTPPGSVVVAPSRHWGFKWFAHRAEYVNYKDAPQDAAGLLEWERRLDVTRRWWESSPTGRFSQADLRRLGEQTGGDYLVTLAYPGRFAAAPLYDNGAYRVYSLPRPAHSRGPHDGSKGTADSTVITD